VSLVLLGIVVLPALGALGATIAGDRRGQLAGRVSNAATGLSLALAAALAVHVALDGPVSTVLERGDGRALGGWYANHVGVALLLLVCGVSTVAQAFAARYLRGDSHAGRFFAATGLLTAATAAMVSAATLIGLAIAWTIAGLALWRLLGLYGRLPAAREGARRTAHAFLIGDLALWIAVAVATAQWGALDLRELSTLAPVLAADQAVTALVACLLVIAAIVRCAQLPAQQWLPATLAAPTPVSALLHAGVVNAGGVLLVKLAPVFGASVIATHLAFLAGAATVIYGTTLMLVKPDVKGALAHSTMGQMGFMIMTCGLGAFAAAIFHLIAHGMYKAALFLGSGAAVHRHVRHVKAPPMRALSRRTRAAIAALAVLAPALALGAAATWLHPAVGGVQGSGALLVFAWTTGAWSAWGWLCRHPSTAGVLTLLAASILAALGYVAVLSAVTAFLAPAISPATAAVSPWLLAPVLAVFALATLVRLAPANSRLREPHKTLYVLALGAGHVTAQAAGHRAGARQPRRGGLGALIPRSQANRS